MVTGVSQFVSDRDFILRTVRVFFPNGMHVLYCHSVGPGEHVSGSPGQLPHMIRSAAWAQLLVLHSASYRAKTVICCHLSVLLGCIDNGGILDRSFLVNTHSLCNTILTSTDSCLCCCYVPAPAGVRCGTLAMLLFPLLLVAA